MSSSSHSPDQQSTSFAGDQSASDDDDDEICVDDDRADPIEVSNVTHSSLPGTVGDQLTVLSAAINAL